MTAIGFYGKLPCRGDFITRLSKQFVSPWDDWLQQCIAYCQANLEDNWKTFYEQSPLWRFYLAPGICGKSAWLGIMMPSADKVGRYFPLTLACNIQSTSIHLEAFSNKALLTWFAKLENIALYALEPTCNLEGLEQKLGTITAPNLADTPTLIPSAHDTSNNQQNWFIQSNNDKDFSTDFTSLLNNLSHDKNFSLWWWLDFEQQTNSPATLLLSNNLPSPEQFPALLDGEWIHWGWKSV